MSFHSKEVEELYRVQSEIIKRVEETSKTMAAMAATNQPEEELRNAAGKICAASSIFQSHMDHYQTLMKALPITPTPKYPEYDENKQRKLLQNQANLLDDHITDLDAIKKKYAPKD